MGLSLEQMEMMMADMQMMADQLPPGIFLQILRLMSQLDMEDMMFPHQQIHMGPRCSSPQSQILTFILELTR